MSASKKSTPTPRGSRGQKLTITSVTVKTRPGETETQALARGVARLVRMIETGKAQS